MTPRLSPALLPDLASHIAAPRYDRAALREGVVHLGLGAFHRAHQALCFEALAQGGDLRWGVVGVSLRSPGVRDRLVPQDGLYTVVERDGQEDRARIVGILKRILVAPEDPQAVVAAMAAPDVHLVTLTITEKGYGLDRATGGLDPGHADIAADLASLAAPRSAAGFIVAALDRRRRAGLPPFVALSCDNLPHNGALLRNAVLALARAHDAALADWIAQQVTFPASMVDRIVPATTTEQIDRFAQAHGYRDEGLIETEPFSQWVIEDSGSANVRALAQAGAQVTADVAPFEAAKLRLLNGAHSMIAYMGGLAGIDHVHEFVADPQRRALVEALWNESEATLASPPDLDLRAYREELMARFANPALHHRTRQIAMDGSQKLPQRLIAPLRARLAAGLPAPMLELAIAGWMAWQRGIDAAGRPFAVDDPLAARTAPIWAEGSDLPTVSARLLGLAEIFGDPASLPGAASGIASWLDRLLVPGSLDTLLHLSAIRDHAS